MFLLILLVLGLAYNVNALARFLNNYHFLFSRAEKSKSLKGEPNFKISILVPARNEENNIETCLRSILVQDYPNFEVIVCDDQSTDKTANILHELKQEYSKLTVINSTLLPSKWKGKCWACHNLSKAASGEWSVFLDADVVLKQGFIKYYAQVICTMDPRVKVLNGYPKQIIGCFGEMLVIPYFIYTYFTSILFEENEDLDKKNKFQLIGQCLWFHHQTYKKFGGHHLVYDQIVEDQEFGRQLKMLGIQIRDQPIYDFVYCRMYRGFWECWNGFKKALFPASKANPYLKLIVILIFLVHVFPYLFIWGTFLGIVEYNKINLFIAGASHLVFVGNFYYGVTKLSETRLKWLVFIILPLDAIIGISIFLSSIAAASRGNLVWKGRSYASQK